MDVPGVDAGGNLNGALGATIPMRANVNTNTGAVRASGRGTVTNLSGQTQHYENVPVDIPDVSITSNRYTVNKRGKCVAIAAGVVNLPE
ncbi:MAG: hypothetical protein DWH91_04275 [Planctomycetota bacterium]|nr:MAG: hypothetical protein DWH91_04275 [Planctomycetota bacterium]